MGQIHTALRGDSRIAVPAPLMAGLMGWVESSLIDALYGLLADEEEKRAQTILAWRRVLWAQMTAFMETYPQPVYLSENLQAA